MQTFLPYPGFSDSARVLDNQRLGKQRVEVLQLMRGQWKHHPAAKMWRGYEFILGLYGREICWEWRYRGFADTCLEKITLEMERFKATGMPPWLGDPAFHVAHRSNLLRKNPEHYRQYFDAPTDLPYIWPGETKP